jgi:hypothetical protein
MMFPWYVIGPEIKDEVNIPTRISCLLSIENFLSENIGRHGNADTQTFSIMKSLHLRSVNPYRIYFSNYTSIKIALETVVYERLRKTQSQ